jgi:SEC-C motif domain protein
MTSTKHPTDPCPCGAGAAFGRCCLPLHRGEREADTAEVLMRARYSAYAVGDLDYVWRTWHPRTRPDELTPDPGLTWTGLDVVEAFDGRPGDESGEVEFRAHYRKNERSGQSAPAVVVGTLHERSRFAFRAGRWFYFDGELFR